METKEFTREHLDVLADMVLAEMGRLREFSNGHSEVVREALSDEIARLHTLYNYLIASGYEKAVYNGRYIRISDGRFGFVSK